MLYDKDIREPLFEFLEETYGRVRIIEEKMMGRSRADVVMVTDGALYGIEIKSDADNYTRLERQVQDYDKYFDYNIVVVGTSHAAHIKEHVPDWWGIITAEYAEVVDFYILRAPQSNPNMNWYNKIKILWRPELAHIQEMNAMPKYKDKSKQFVAEKILERVPEETLRYQFTEELFERDYTAIWDKIQEYRISNGRKPRRRKKKIRVKIKNL